MIRRLAITIAVYAEKEDMLDDKTIADAAVNGVNLRLRAPYSASLASYRNASRGMEALYDALYQLGTINEEDLKEVVQPEVQRLRKLIQKVEQGEL